jgi:hypothetical protein
MLSLHSEISTLDACSVIGNTELLRCCPALILNSRQSKTPVGNDRWVKHTVDASKAAISSGFPLIASMGMNTWELVLWACGEFEGRAVVICPLHQNENIEEVAAGISDDFSLNTDDHAWIGIRQKSNGRCRKGWWEARDEIAFNIAARIYPISVRENGRLNGLIRDTRIDGKVIVDDYLALYEKARNENSKFGMHENCAAFPHWQYLTHWTKRRYGPWPGEKSSEFYRAIARSDRDYPRSASFTFKRILEERRLRASGNHLLKGISAVSFTALNPSEAIPLMRWRRRYVMPTFEPYGIGIHYRAALKIGIKPVTYVKTDSDAPEVAPELIQRFGTGDWPKEKEWRAIGDVDLTQIPVDDILILVPSKEEAIEFEQKFPYKVQAIISE